MAWAQALERVRIGCTLKPRLVKRGPGAGAGAAQRVDPYLEPRLVKRGAGAGAGADRAADHDARAVLLGLLVKPSQV